VLAGDLPALNGEGRVLTPCVSPRVEMLGHCAPTSGPATRIALLKQLTYTTPMLWGKKTRADGMLVYAPEEIDLSLAASYRISTDR
jgi:hypothetical protein